MAWTSAADVLDRWVGSGKPDDENLISLLIDDAEAVILAEFPRIQERITAGTLDESVIRLVVARMVSRLVRNPENLSYWQQNTGPFGQGRNFGDKVDIWLSPEEKKILAPVTRGKAFSTDLAPDKVSGRFNLDAFETFESQGWKREEDD